MKVWKLKKKKNNKINKYLSVFNRLMCFSKLHQNRLSPMISNTSDSPYDGCKTGNAPMSLELGYYLSVACSWDPMKQFESPSVPSEFWTCPKVRGDLMWPFSHIKQMWCIVQLMRQDVRNAKFMIANCFKELGSQLWKGYKASSPDNDVHA